MDSPGSLPDNIMALLAEMHKLQDVKNDVEKKGKRQMERWLQSVKVKEEQVDKIQKEFEEIKGKSYMAATKAKLNLNNKVIECINAVKVVREMADLISESMEMFISQVATEKTLQFSYWQLKKYTSNFTERIGDGSFGLVYKGELHNGARVAVKVLRDGVPDEEKQFMAEAGIMGKTYHRNLVKLYGFCFDKTMKALVYEYMENGSLDKVLFENRLEIKWKQLYLIAIETAKGLSYLHEHCDERIIHCDIKAANVLLDSNLSAKITDFGLAKLYATDKSQVTFSGLRETRDNDAPEVRMGLPRITYKCDVFSYGMMLFELLSRRKNCEGQNSFPRRVWEKFHEGQLDTVIIDCGINGERDKESARILSLVALWCTQQTPQARPSMSTVVKVLQGKMKLEPPPKPFFSSLS